MEWGKKVDRERGREGGKKSGRLGRVRTGVPESRQHSQVTRTRWEQSGRPLPTTNAMLADKPVPCLDEPTVWEGRKEGKKEGRKDGRKEWGRGRRQA